MKCTRPYVKTLSKGEWIHNEDGSTDYSGYQSIELPCGKCLACRINRRREWTQRLLNEEIYSSSAYFITLTYDDDHLKFSERYGTPCVSKKDIQDFMKRLRRWQDYLTYKKIRFFITTEYGPETERPHAHGILFNVSERILEGGKPKYEKGKFQYWYGSKLQEIWENGEATIAPCARERCSYCAKYFVDRKMVPDYLEPTFSLMSRRPGIGRKYAEAISEKARYYDWNSMLADNGKYVAMPRYYRNIIWNDDERKLKFEDFVEQHMNKSLEELQQEQVFYDNADVIEENRYRAMTWKGIKSKI